MELNQNREGTGRKERLSTDHESWVLWEDIDHHQRGINELIDDVN